MLFRIFSFEVSYRLKRPATWVYFAIMFLMAFGMIAVQNIVTSVGPVKDNAPIELANTLVSLLALPGFLIISAVMGMPILRDYEHQTSAMIFTTPIRKSDYLLGRFLGSFVIVLLIFSGMLFGLMVGMQMPWMNPDNLLPFNAYHYFQPFLVLVIPSLFFASALFFAGGALSKNLLFVFVQGISILVFWMLAGLLAKLFGSQTLGALLDPVGLAAMKISSQYWSVTEQNTLLYAFDGLILANRLLWIGLGVLVLGLTLWRFSFTEPAKSRRKRKTQQVQNLPKPQELTAIPIPVSKPKEGFRTQVQQVWRLSRLYFKEIVFSVPFIAVSLLGLVLFIALVTELNSIYGTETYPTTYQVLEAIRKFELYFLILVIFYGGEVIWRERDLRMSQIFDAMPIPIFVTMLGKFMGMVAVYIVLLLVLIGAGIIFQTSKGYFQYELGLYFTTVFTETFSFLILYTCLVFFIQVIVNQKLLAHAVVLIFFIIKETVLSYIGLYSDLWQFGSGTLGTYSDMNAYGHFLKPFIWFKVYWLSFGLLLFTLGALLAVRGTDSFLKTRLKLVKLRFTRPIAIFSMVALMVFAFSGSYIYYNANYRNDSLDDNAFAGNYMELLVDYEKRLKQYEYLPQPKIVETNLQVDLFPQQRNFVIEGYYILKNKSKGPISHIHIQSVTKINKKQKELSFEQLDGLDQGNTVVEEFFPEHDYLIYKLDHPMQVGDSVKMNFKVKHTTTGFVSWGSNTEVVYNGTFFNNKSYLPAFGYNAEGELHRDKDREEYGLPPKEEGMRKRNDSIGQKMPLFGDDANKIRFEIVIGTDSSQIGLAPGYLQRDWVEGDRRFFHYKMDKPMFNFYSIVSARYEVMKEPWKTPQGQDINLEIYYHPGHTYNLERMIEAMKSSFAYYERHFSPYQFSQMRIMEFPRYKFLAQSFANTVPFSEGLGFILNIGADDIDVAYYVTAHELSHQWWGHQVSEAGVQGHAMLSETMAQYSALMVMKQSYPPEIMQKFLRHELNIYLRDRSSTFGYEVPLALVEGQKNIFYNKGSIVMYALQDYIGEDSVNAALRRYLQTWQGREDRYPTTADLLPYFREVTPDSLQYIITDMFETITFFENRVDEPTYKPLADGQYRVTIPVKSEKFRADSLGVQTSIPLQDWIDVGVFASGNDGKDSLVYLQKHKLTEKETTFEVIVGAKPVKAGIDPMHKLIDRNPDDNVENVGVVE